MNIEFLCFWNQSKEWKLLSNDAKLILIQQIPIQKSIHINMKLCRILNKKTKSGQTSPVCRAPQDKQFVNIRFNDLIFLFSYEHFRSALWIPRPAWRIVWLCQQSKISRGPTNTTIDYRYSIPEICLQIRCVIRTFRS